MTRDSAKEDAPPRDVIRHLALLGDALQNIDFGEEEAEAVLVPRPRNPWKLTVLDAPQVLEQRRVRAIPRDATHVALCVDGGWAIEASGLLQGDARSISGALDSLAKAADAFEEIYARLIAAALEAGLPTIVCTLVPARHLEPSQQRVAATALAIFSTTASCASHSPRACRSWNCAWSATKTAITRARRCCRTPACARSPTWRDRRCTRSPGNPGGRGCISRRPVHRIRETPESSLRRRQ